MALESLDIRVRQQGARTVARDIRNIGFAASAVSGQLSTTSRILRGLAFASVARRVAAFADSFTNLNNRVRIYSRSTDEANKTTSALIGIANKTRVATDAVSLTYQRLAINQDRLGLSTERVLRLTELLGKAVATGGSSAQEAGGALRQFSQALASDFRAAAQELNSVLEQTPGLAKALADGLGTTTDQIKVLAKEGRLSSQVVIQALEAQADVIDARFAKIQPTIGQAFQVLNNSLEVFVGRVFQATDAGKLITDTLINFSQILLRLAADEERLNEIIDKTVTALTFLVKIKIVSFLKGIAREMDAVVVATARFIALNAGKAFQSLGISALFARKSLQGARFASVTDELLSLQAASRGAGGGFSKVFAGLGNVLKSPIKALGTLINLVASLGRAVLVAFVTNPIGIFVTAVVTLTSILFGLRNETVKIAGETVQLRDIAVAAFQVMTERVKALFERLEDVGGSFVDNIGGLRGFVNSSLAGFTALGRIVAAFFRAFVKDAVSAFNVVGKAFDNVVNAFKLAFQGDFQGAFEALTAPVADDFQSELATLGQQSGKILGEEMRRDFLQEFASIFEGTDIGKRARELAAARRAAEQQAGGGDGGSDPTGGNVGNNTFKLLEQQKAVAELVGEFDVATKVAFEFLDAQNKLASAVEKGIITQKEQSALLENLATDRFRRAAAATDEVAQATIDHRDVVAELNALAAAGKIPQDELTDALARQAEQFERTRLEITEYQAALGTTDAFIKGARAGFESFTESLGTVFSNARDLTNTLLDQGLSALDEFVTTGEFNFAEFSKNIIGEVQKVINRLLLIQTIRAFEKTAAEGGGVGGFFGNLLGDRIRGNETGGPDAARTGTGATSGSTGIISDILGGGRQGVNAAGEQAAAGTPADPIFARILESGQETASLVESITQGDSQAADTAVAQMEQQTSLFDSLRETLGGVAERIGGFFTTIGDGLSTIFTGGFNAVTGFLGIGQQKNQEGLQSIVSTNQEGFGGLGGLFQGLLGGGGGGGGLTGLLGGLGGLFGGGGGGASGPAAAGGGGGFLGLLQGALGIFGGFLADGGILSPSNLGQAFITGERGPELFVPRQTGAVVPSDVLAGMGGAAPNVNVQVTNVDDAKAVPEAMSTREGEQVILNTIQRNRGRLKEIIA